MGSNPTLSANSFASLRRRRFGWSSGARRSACGASPAGTNPTLSANISFCVFNNLAGHVGSQRAPAGNVHVSRIKTGVEILRIRPTRATWVLLNRRAPSLTYYRDYEGRHSCAASQRASSIAAARYTSAATSADAGMVNTQAQTICSATPHRTAERRLIDPTPMIAPVIGGWC